MNDDPSGMLFNLLGWLVVAVCVLFGIVRAGPLGAFRSCWNLVAAFFALRLADALAVPLGVAVGPALGASGVPAECVGYWLAAIAVFAISSVWLKFVVSEPVGFPPLVEQVLTPLLGAFMGLCFALALLQTAMTSSWFRERFPAPTSTGRTWLERIDQRWFPGDEVASPTPPVSAPVAQPPPAPATAPAGVRRPAGG